MSATDDYRGIGFSGVDSKWRFTLPVDLRRRVKSGSGENVLFINMAADTPYLTGFAQDYLTDLRERIIADEQAARQRGEAFDRHRRAVESVSGVESVTFDEGGRFSLPDDVKELMDIGDCLFFVGAIWSFEIWSPARFLESSHGTELNRRRCRKFMDDWAANPKNPNAGKA